MKKALTILAVLVLAGSVANAALVPTAVYKVNRDNFNVNYSGETLWNCGSTSNWRLAKDQQEGTYYGDWSESGLMDLATLLATPTPTPGNWWEVCLGIAMTSLASPKTLNIQTLNSVNDWREDFGNKSATGGACNDWADYNAADPGQSIPWVDQGNLTNKLYWGLSSLANSRQMVVTVTGPGLWNEILLDAALVNDLIVNPNNRGIRAAGIWGAGDDNASCAAIGQWGGGGNGWRLAVYDIPEPATMGLLLAGGVAALIRRKR